MAAAMGHRDCYEVVYPQDAKSFRSMWADIGPAVVIHTHGSETSLCGQLDDNSTPLIISTWQLHEMPRNNAIRVAVLTACQTASGNAKHNIAAILSKKISPEGILIASIYEVWGADTYFGERLDRKGWTVYRNGAIIKHPHELPATITLDYACKLYLETP